MVKNKVLNLIVLIVAILFVAIPLAMPDLNIYVGDGANIIARSLSLQNENFFTRVVPEAANGFGYSWSLFEGNLTYGLLKYFLYLQNTGFKLFEFILILLSGFSMFWLVKVISSNNKVGVLAGCLYVMLPYHLTSLYVTNSAVEQLTFVFIPLVFLGAQYLINNSKKHLIYPVAMVLLLLTDNTIGMMIFILSILYLLLNLKTIKDNKCVSRLLLDLCFVFFITSFDWVAKLQTSLSSTYKINNLSDSEKQAFINGAIDFKKLFVTGKNDVFVFEVGPILIAMFGIMPIGIMSIAKQYKKNYVFYLLAFLGFSLCATKLFPWNIFAFWGAKLSSPYRLLNIATFFLVIICSINVGAVVNKLKIRHVVLLVVLNAICVGMLVMHVQKSGINELPYIKFGQITGKQDEVQIGLNRLEYLPEKAYNNRLYLATRTQDIMVLEGKSLVENAKKENGIFTVKIQTIDEVTTYELPYIYYPGYSVKADGVAISTFETENGMLGIKVPAKDNFNIKVEYKGSNEMGLAKIISAVFSVIFVCYFIYEIIPKKKKVEINNNNLDNNQ